MTLDMPKETGNRTSLSCDTFGSSRRAFGVADDGCQPTAQPCETEIVAQLRVELAAQAALLRERETELAHSRKIFARASAAANLGIWECSLPDETLSWTDGTYDLFDLPRGSPLERGRIVECYTDDSREELREKRTRAIEERSGFSMDAEIVTAKGNRRWIRLTATVESEDGVAVRIFGIKRDITEEKLLWERTRYLAEFDLMTGLANRAQFEARFGALCGDAADSSGTLLLVDLDNFKEINDTLGHAAGDACLTEAARRLIAACRDAELVARIGGDEFAVLLGPEAAADPVAGRILEAMRRPVEREGRSLRLGVSIGIAHGLNCSPARLFQMADKALYAAKAAGRDTFRWFTSDLLCA